MWPLRNNGTKQHDKKMKQLEKGIGEQFIQVRKPPPPSQKEVMFPEIKLLAEAMESANSFLTVLFRSVVPQGPCTC